jgi:SAM-dependent methyltransferase
LGRYDVEKQKWDQKTAHFLVDEQDLVVTRRFDIEFTERNVLRPVAPFLKLPDRQARILDYGCGAGWTAVLLAQASGRVDSFDISHTAVKGLRRIAAVNKLDNLHPCVADGERLPYPDGCFDLVFAHAVLHHLELDKALKEISRVLKPGGRAAFCEPFAHNPLINLYRYIKHHWVEEHVGTDKPLRYADLAIVRRHFKEVTLIETSFLRDTITWLRPLERWLLRIPIFRPLVVYVTILATK